MRDLQRIYQWKGQKLTQQQVIVAYLWEVDDWVPTHELVKLERPYGRTGSDGDRRARELADNECEEKLRGKVEKEEGEKLGLDKRYTYFRYRREGRALSPADIVIHARELCAFFDAYPVVK